MQTNIENNVVNDINCLLILKFKEYQKKRFHSQYEGMYWYFIIYLSIWNKIHSKKEVSSYYYKEKPIKCSQLTSRLSPIWHLEYNPL